MIEFIMGFITGATGIVLAAYSLRGWWRHKANKALFKEGIKVETNKLSAQEAYTVWIDTDKANLSGAAFDLEKANVNLRKTAEEQAFMQFLHKGIKKGNKYD